jgi:hypothetical protein
MVNKKPISKPKAPVKTAPSSDKRRREFRAGSSVARVRATRGRNA